MERASMALVIGQGGTASNHSRNSRVVGVGLAIIQSWETARAVAASILSLGVCELPVASLIAAARRKATGRDDQLRLRRIASR
jgi:hypothetical protein